jgi:hypothetical protein
VELPKVIGPIQLNRTDLIQAYTFLFSRALGTICIWLLVLSALGFGYNSLVKDTTLRWDPNFTVQAFGLLIFAFILALARNIFNVSKQLKELEHNDRPLKWTITSEYLQVEGPLQSIRVPWIELTSVKLSASSLLVREQSSVHFVMPLRAFETETEIRATKEWIKEKMTTYTK